MSTQAQEQWKELWRAAHKAKHEGAIMVYDECLEDLYGVRREAALERRIAALERQNAAHTMRVNGVIRIINDGADEWQHVYDEEAESCEYCGYDWPCRYETMRRALVGLDDANMILCEVPHDKIEVTA